MKRFFKRSINNLLNIQSLKENFEKKGILIKALIRNEAQNINGFQFFHGQKELFKDYVYLCQRDTLEKNPFLLKGGFMIILGQPKEESLSIDASYFIVSKKYELYTIANVLQEILTKYLGLEKKLHEILNNKNSLDDICSLGVEHFKNPVFIHDEFFNILSCPQVVKGVTNFIYNEQTKRLMQDTETLNNFRISREYKKTLETYGGQLWTSDFDESRSIYANIWFDNNYKGRFIVVENNHLFTQGQILEAEYFAEVIKNAILQRYMKSGEEINIFQNFIKNALEGKSIDFIDYDKKLQGLGWKRENRYVCGVLSFEEKTISRLTTFVTCNEIQKMVPGTLICYHENILYMLINLSIGHLQLSDLRMGLSKIIRESLLRGAISNVFKDSHLFPLHIDQARVTLQIAKDKDLTSWYNEFQDCVLEYWMTMGFNEFTKETILHSALLILRDYDKANGTDLYQTLKTYLIHERNSTLTANILKIHRSTLPHRLERINQLTHLNLDSFKTRLYLLMSFEIS